MKHHIFTLCSLLVISAFHAAESQAPDAAGRWSAAKAKQWYDSQPWPCGFNYIPAHAISYTEMWMPYKKMKTKIKYIVLLLSLAASSLFNKPHGQRARSKPGGWHPAEDGKFSTV